ncbi:helix-turn-helix transcriptional regulator [Phenylobacterium sp.]|jgi:DNA-binding CsgD family transcriptional regulator|uniref:helix-turn-helix transcriptional regulator n=1 Tax=Phenylobacterium sp. TaxID=1871053 RepID=UPI002F93A9CB
MVAAQPAPGLALAEGFARQLASLAAEIGLPYLAAAADISSPRPPVGVDGRPLAETIFRWVDPDLRYWEDRGFALRAAFIHAARQCAEPFWFRDGTFGSWRPNAVLDALSHEGPIETFGVGAAIVTPTYLPGGVIGAVVWATPDADFDVQPVFDARAGELQSKALRFVAAYDEAAGGAHPPAVRLTRREIQCLKWAAAGKTDVEIGQIVGISLPTVRFHITNASRKMGVNGRTQAIHHAGALGYIGAERPRPTAA